MKITKYSHACVRVEHDGGVLVIDPGEYSEAEAVRGADAIIATHQHADHLHVEHLQAAYEANRDLVLLAPADTVEVLGDLGGLVTPVAPGEEHVVAGLRVTTHGGTHATIIDEYPVPQNVGYLVDDRLYYPGDSFALPERPVETLLAPVSAPWLKIAETIAFVRAVAPERVHPTHDAILSPLGHGLVDAWLERAGRSASSRLPIGTPVDL